MKAVAVHGNWWADLCEAESKLVMTSTHGGPPLEPPASLSSCLQSLLASSIRSLPTVL